MFYASKQANTLNVQALWEQILVTLLAIIFTSLGVFMMVKANFILNPPDGIINVFCKKLKYLFGKTKFGFDLTMIIIS
ncbi:MAG: hypothetical protein ABF778_07180, partial [Liquorilactobacillus hordei]